LQTTNNQLRATNADLQKTSKEISENNANLTRQVTELTLHVSQLKESAERIKAQMQLFAQTNTLFGENLVKFTANLNVLDDQITSSHTLCNKITQCFSSQQTELNEQIRQIKEYFCALSAQNSVTQHIEQFTALNKSIQEAKNELHAMQLQREQERSRLEEIRDILVRLRPELADSINALRSSNRDHAAHNQTLQSNVERFSQLLAGLKV
jgi:chromosome segregation ATPase